MVNENLFGLGEHLELGCAKWTWSSVLELRAMWEGGVQLEGGRRPFGRREGPKGLVRWYGINRDAAGDWGQLRRMSESQN